MRQGCHCGRSRQGGWESSPGRIISGRARVLRTKRGEGDLQAKSRIIVPGDRDQGLGEFRSDAPTAPQVCLYNLLAIAASKGWPLQAFDVATAFLNGVKLGRLLCQAAVRHEGGRPA